VLSITLLTEQYKTLPTLGAQQGAFTTFPVSSGLGTQDEFGRSTDTQLDSESHTPKLPIHQSNIYQCLCYGEIKSDTLQEKERRQQVVQFYLSLLRSGKKIA